MQALLFMSKGKDQIQKEKALIRFFLLNIASFCDKCGAKYQIENLEALDMSSKTCILQASCKKCKNMLLANVAKQVGLSTKTHLKLDIESNQVTSKIMAGLISTDEILSFHKNFKKCQNLTDLIKVVR